MFKAKVIGALALTALTGLGAISVYVASAENIPASTANQAIHASQRFATCSDSESDGVMSRKDEKGNFWCSEDDGATWISEAAFKSANPTPVFEWWTYDSYNAWLAQEKVTLQKMADEKIEVQTSENKFVWTQKMTNQLIAEYEQTLKDIENGLLVSKSVDENGKGMASYNPKYIVKTHD